MSNKQTKHSSYCRRGHIRSVENTWLNPKDNRIYCRICWKLRAEINREKIRIQARYHYKKHKEEISSIRKLMHKSIYEKTKIEVLTYYGNGRLACVCCGENILQMLTIDHILPIGNKDKKERQRRGWSLYEYLKKNRLPFGYQTLCFNCNSGRAINKGICPHKTVKCINLLGTKLKDGDELRLN